MASRTITAPALQVMKVSKGDFKRCFQVGMRGAAS
jgi:hypothetical protein